MTEKRKKKLIFSAMECFAKSFRFLHKQLIDKKL